MINPLYIKKKKKNMVFCSSILAEKNKVLFIMEATGIGKNKFTIYLDTRFLYEIINSDKI
ncbi:isopentenyltransferase [Medicago truncatula]|uniref:Isopentenyltransferase n=1 Tax=Medicago truncatula TaxID=3880 RepID=G7ZY21_MEDTR|nr:isopentenyltransferase [Medicago truncatula]